MRHGHAGKVVLPGTLEHAQTNARWLQVCDHAARLAHASPTDAEVRAAETKLERMNTHTPQARLPL